MWQRYGVGDRRVREQPRAGDEPPAADARDLRGRSCSATSSGGSRTSGWRRSSWGRRGSTTASTRSTTAGGLLGRHVEAYGVTVADLPSDIFKENIWVSPFPEDDIAHVVDLIGADRVLLGSDWPHLEGTPQPIDYLRAARQARRRQRAADHARQRTGAAHVSTSRRPSRSSSRSTRPSSTTSTSGCGGSAGPTTPTTRPGASASTARTSRSSCSGGSTTTTGARSKPRSTPFPTTG